MTRDDAGWPVALRGVTESVVTTLGPNDRWNVAALGVLAPQADGPATARTWGHTRTRRNFTERGEGYVQFTRDPVDFVEAALTVREESDPVLSSVDAWARVETERIDAGTDGGTEWVEWALRPREARVERRSVAPVNRGFGAVVEATVIASRLDVPAYDEAEQRERLRWLASVVDRCGGEPERSALDLVAERVDLER